MCIVIRYCIKKIKNVVHEYKKNSDPRIEPCGNAATPEVRGTAESHGAAHPLCLTPLVRPHDDHHYFDADQRAKTENFF